MHFVKLAETPTTGMEDHSEGVHRPTGRAGRLTTTECLATAPAWGQFLLLSHAPVANPLVVSGTEGSTNWKSKREMYWFTQPGLGLPPLQGQLHPGA